MNPAVAELCERLDVHVELLDRLVEATQQQKKALLGYRPGTAERDERLSAANARLTELVTAVDRHGPRTRDAADVVARSYGQADYATLSALAATLPEPEREALRERLSCVRSLTEALAELSQINHLHARRGLQLVSAWRSIVTRGETTPTTYNAKGRPRSDTPTGSLTLNI